MSTVNSTQPRVAVNCSYCGRMLEVAARLSGQTVRCECGSRINVPWTGGFERQTQPCQLTASKKKALFRFLCFGSALAAALLLVCTTIFRFGLSSNGVTDPRPDVSDKANSISTHSQITHDTAEEVLKRELDSVLDFSLEAEQIKPMSMDSGWATAGGGSQYVPAYDPRDVSNAPVPYSGFVAQKQSAKYEWWTRDIQMANGEVSCMLRYRFIPNGPMYRIEISATWPHWDPPEDYKQRLPGTATVMQDKLSSFRLANAQEYMRSHKITAVPVWDTKAVQATNEAWLDEMYKSVLSAHGTYAWWKFSTTKPAPRERPILILNASISGAKHQNVAEFLKVHPGQEQLLRIDGLDLGLK